MASSQGPKTLPQTFSAAAPFIGFPAALTLLGVLGSGYISQHQPKIGVLFWALTGLYLLLTAVLMSLRVRVDADGLTQRWLFSSTRIGWKQVGRVDRTGRGYALLGLDSKELVLLRFLPLAAQQTVAEETIARARLRKVAGAPTAPILEQWERKSK